MPGVLPGNTSESVAIMACGDMLATTLIAKPADRLVAGAFRAVDLVVDVVFADRFYHRYPFYLFEAVGIVDDDGPVHVPDAEQGILSIAGELDMSRGLAR